MDDGTAYAEEQEKKYFSRVRKFINFFLMIFCFSIAVFGLIYGIRGYVQVRDSKSIKSSADFPPRDIMPNVYETQPVIRFEKTLCYNCHGR